MKTHQVSLSHWGIFWCRVTAQIKLSLKGYDMYGNPTEEGVITEIFEYQPLQYMDEIDYEPIKHITGLRMENA